jgi:hypothetical protein
MKSIPELIIIAGTGRNSGKTTLACKLISRFADLEISSVKISPHIHNQTEGSSLLHSAAGYTIHTEISIAGDKDSSRMLGAGAKRSYYIFATDKSIEKAFNWLLENRECSGPIICESPALRRFFNPGLFIIADSDIVIDRKDLSSISDSSDITIQMEDSYYQINRILFGNGRWYISV